MILPDQVVEQFLLGRPADVSQFDRTKIARIAVIGARLLTAPVQA